MLGAGEADAQACRNLTVTEPFANESQNLPFARRKDVRCWRPAAGAHGMMLISGTANYTGRPDLACPTQAEMAPRPRNRLTLRLRHILPTIVVWGASYDTPVRTNEDTGAQKRASNVERTEYAVETGCASKEQHGDNKASCTGHTPSRMRETAKRSVGRPTKLMSHA